MKKFFYPFATLIIVGLTFAACGSDDDNTPTDNPTKVVAGDIEFPKAKGGSSIIVRHYAKLNERTNTTVFNYAVEWDTEKRAQRWSCYKMYNGINTKNVSRYNWGDNTLELSGQYPNDIDLPEQYRFTVDPYRGSGFDHGHICPSADRLSSQEINIQTFFMTNMQPQYGQRYNNFNGGIWADMEGQVRQWASIFDTLYVCKGGTIDNEKNIITYIGSGENKIPVPRYFFMAVVGRKGDTFKGTAFWIDQENFTSESLRRYVFTIGELQEKTGIDFFHNLPDDIENEVENVTHVQMQRDWSWYK
ncbi:MAG: DNA/RNA non-specific endonuclease [Prevotella sp.]|nr:DNA/RNA non-specific endonuclease [Prevotella sp.]